MMLVAASCRPPRPRPPARLLPTCRARGLQSNEETRGDTLVYRPNTYKLPPSRGRTGLLPWRPLGRFNRVRRCSHRRPGRARGHPDGPRRHPLAHPPRRS
ncbi:MAG: hypothetical protein WKG07_12190 [Hymenobacter sp.]